MDSNQQTNNRRKLLLARLCAEKHKRAMGDCSCDGRYACFTCHMIAALHVQNGKLPQCLRLRALTYCGKPN